MHIANLVPRVAVVAALILVPTAGAQQLTAVERRIIQEVRAGAADQLALLSRSVDIGSGSLNVAGVRAVGRLYEAELRAMGFDVRWVEMPASMARAGHLFAERRGRRARGRRLLLIGHLDTVFEGEGQRFARVDSVIARGAGTNDMKGGNAVIIHALRALHRARTLDDATITVAFTGDEERVGHPIDLARRDLIEAARRSDVALAFETGAPGQGTVGRRGASTWLLRVTGRQAHSSGVFSPGTGYGAVYEAARILDEFRRELGGRPGLTYNAAAIVGGTDVGYDTATSTGTVGAKTNIVPRTATVQGDLRFLSEAQKDSARATMRAIVARNLPGTSAEITFQDMYPSMEVRPENLALLATLDSVSRALGHGAIAAGDPIRRGAGDISFVAPIIPGLDGLGAYGRGAHSPEEEIDLRSLVPATERAALLLYRLLTPR